MHIRESKHAKKMTRMRVDVYLDHERSMRYHKNEVSAQLRDNFEHVIEQDKSIMYHNQINQSVNQSISHLCGAPTNAHFYFE